MPLTMGWLWRSARDRFVAAGIDTAALDARLLLRHLLGLDETALVVSEGEAVGEAEERIYEALIARRLAGEPVARILGVKEFYGLPFRLNAAALVPRPETEMLVDFGIGLLRGREEATLLDLGTGTGCIALALLAHLPGATAVGVDLSSEAAACAQANAEALGLGDRFTVLTGSWFTPIGPGARFDCIFSNPPYIERAALPGLAAEVRDFDPRLGLDGGADGLDAYREIAAQAGAFLVPGGALVLEIGAGQGRAVRGLFEETGFEEITVSSDLAGHDRMVTARR